MPSLSIGEASGGKLLLDCHAGCTFHEIIRALGLRSRGRSWASGSARGPQQSRRRAGAPAARPATMQRTDSEAVLPVPADAPKPDFQHFKLGTPDATWTYRDLEGAVLFHVARFDLDDGKQVLPPCYGRLNGRTGWHWKAAPAPRPLFRLDRLTDWPRARGRGRKTARAAAKLCPDHFVTTWPGGAAAIAKVDWGTLAGRDVTIWPDADEPGHKAAARIAAALQGIAATVRVVTLPPGSAEGLGSGRRRAQRARRCRADRGCDRGRNRGAYI